MVQLNHEQESPGFNRERNATGVSFQASYKTYPKQRFWNPISHIDIKRSNKPKDTHMQAMKDYKYHSAINMRFYPSYSQKAVSGMNFGASRFVYNRMVSLNEEKYRLRKTAPYCPTDRARLDYVTTVLSDLKNFQNTVPFLDESDIDAQCVANARANYSKAWANFRKNPAAGTPTFHKRRYETSYQTNPHYRKDGGCNVYFDGPRHVMLPKLGRCRVSGSPKLMERLFARIKAGDIRFGTITVSRDAIGRYFISIQLASDTPFREALPPSGSMRGYDMNLGNFYTDSDGNAIDSPRYRRGLQKRLSKCQKVMSRRMERAKKEHRSLWSAKNYQRSRRKAAYINAKAAGRRDDFQHVLSKHEVESQDFIFVEDLRTKNLLRNHRLAFAISDAAWGSFHNRLEYKAAMYGRTFLKVDARLTSQTCSECGYILPKGERLTLKVREWACPACGILHSRDHNSAKVILARGMASLGMCQKSPVAWQLATVTAP